MRLTEAQLTAIRDSATEAFGEHAGVWLFGSRIDDSRRGGDIDLLVSPMLPDAAERLAAKLRFLAQLERRLGERKIDVLVAAPDDEREIVKTARNNGVRLQ